MVGCLLLLLSGCCRVGRPILGFVASFRSQRAHYSSYRSIGGRGRGSDGVSGGREGVWLGVMGDVWSWSWIRSSTFGSGCDAARLTAFPCLPAAAPACIQTGLDWPELSGCGGAVWGGNCLCEPYPCCHPCCSPPRALTEVSIFANHRSVGCICRLLGMQLQVSSPVSQEIALGVALYFIVEH